MKMVGQQAKSVGFGYRVEKLIVEAQKIFIICRPVKKVFAVVSPVPDVIELLGLKRDAVVFCCHGFVVFVLEFFMQAHWIYIGFT